MNTATATATKPAPAWTQESYLADMADRITARLATMRQADRELARLAGEIPPDEIRKSPDYRRWDSRRAGAANDVLICVRGMAQMGYDTDPASLGILLRDEYRKLLRNLRDNNGGPIPATYVPDTWLEGLNHAELLALARGVWLEYTSTHKAE